MKNNFSKTDYEFMNALSEAIVRKTSTKIRLVLFFWFVVIIGFIIWASFTKVNEIVRGKGQVIPSGNNKIVQNLEGGIVEKIYVKKGEFVKKGQPLVKIKNQKSLSYLEATKAKILAYEIKIKRLQAEANGENQLIYSDRIKKIAPEIVKNELSLFKSDKAELNSKIATLKEQLNQKQHELQNAKISLKLISDSLKIIKKELKMTIPMVKQGVKSKIELYKLQRQVNNLENKYQSTKISIPKIESAIKEIRDKINTLKLQYQNEAKDKLTNAITQLRALKAQLQAYKDTIKRTIVVSPIDGIINKLYVNTIGEVIKPGGNIAEIVPINKKLLIKTKIKPRDIGFLYPGQKAIVKFTAYDYTIFGSMKGKVTLISPDTEEDRKGNVYYIVYVQTNKNYLEKNGKKLKIKPGMIAIVDIVTGKKTVMDYLLKPILKTKTYAFTEK